MLGMTIRCDDKLFAGLVEAVEGVKELLEDLFLAIEEMNQASLAQYLSVHLEI